MVEEAAPGGTDEIAVLEIAFAEGVRKLVTVQEAAESIRSRSGTLMAVATAVGAFLGGVAVDRSPQGWQWLLAAGGLISYLAALAVLVYVLLPKKGGWVAGQNTSELARIAGTERHTKVLRELAIAYQGAFDACEERVRSMARCFGIGVALMVAELLCFSCLLGLASQNPAPRPENPAAVSTTQPAVSTTQP